MTPKLSVTTDKELLRLGNDVLELQDASSCTYKTDDLTQFLKFCEAESKRAGYGLILFYTANMVELHSSEVFSNPRGFDPLASCTMATHTSLASLIAANNCEQAVDDFEKFLRRHRKNFAAGGLEILDNIRDLSFAKVKKVERKKERNGNFHYTVKRESAGDGDYTPPESISFKVPLFQGVDIKRELEFDLEFDFKEVGERVDLLFTLENLTLQEDLEEARRAVMAEALAPSGIQSYWGSLNRSIKTDEWSKKINQASL